MRPPSGAGGMTLERRCDWAKETDRRMSRAKRPALWLTHVCYDSFRANYYTPEITKVKFDWTMPLKVHWTIPETIHWTSDNPLETNAEKWRSVGNCHWSPLEHATWNPQWCLRSISGVRYFAPYSTNLLVDPAGIYYIILYYIVL